MIPTVRDIIELPVVQAGEPQDDTPSASRWAADVDALLAAEGRGRLPAEAQLGRPETGDGLAVAARQKPGIIAPELVMAIGQASGNAALSIWVGEGDAIAGACHGDPWGCATNDYWREVDGCTRSFVLV